MKRSNGKSNKDHMKLKKLKDLVKTMNVSIDACRIVDLFISNYTVSNKNTPKLFW